MGWLERRKQRKLQEQEEFWTLVRKARQYDEAYSLVMSKMAEQVAPYPAGKSRRVAVDQFVFDMYETLIHPSTRYIDVPTAHEGYSNLLYKNFVITVGPPWW